MVQVSTGLTSFSYTPLPHAPTSAKSALVPFNASSLFFRVCHSEAYMLCCHRQESVLRPLATRAASATPPARSTPPAPSSSLSSFSSTLASGRRPAAASPLSELAASLNSSRSSAQNENFSNLLSVNRVLSCWVFCAGAIGRRASVRATGRPH